MRQPSSTTALLLVTLFLSACAVGPDFKTPDSPAVDSYAPKGYPNKTSASKTLGGAAQKFNVGADIPAAWWTLFRSKPLTDLIEKALQNNPNLQAAEAALRQAQENVASGQGANYPTVTGAVSGSRRKASGAASDPFTLYNTSVSVAYPLDVFGGVQRSVEGLEALAEVQYYEKEAAYTTLAANIVTAAINEASIRAQISALQDIIKSEKKQLELLNQQLELGGISKTNVLAQAATLARTEASLPTLEKQLTSTRNLLSALAGQFPSQNLQATFSLETLHLPDQVPVSLPSQLVAQRPDIRAASAQLHAASAAIGVATANMLPQITLTGGYGVEGMKISDLFSPGTAVWSLGGALAQPLFKGGELLHKKRASEAAYDRAAALYKSTVLSAFQEVADALNALEADAESLKAQLAAERAAHDNLVLARDQFNAGSISYLMLLTAEQTYEEAKINLVQAQGRRYADTAALFHALGGGWWNKKDAGPQTKATAKTSEPKASLNARPSTPVLQKEPTSVPSLGTKPAYLL